MDSFIFLKGEFKLSKINFTKIAHNIRLSISKHSPEILTGIGIAGMITTTVLAVKATPKAIKIIDELKRERLEEGLEEPTKVDYVKSTWQCYIPSAVTGVASIACLIGASSVSARRNAALMTAYKLSETAISEYKSKVVETIGEKKEKAIRDKVAEDRVKSDPVTKKEVFITNKGKTLCYDYQSGRYFESDIDEVKKVENKLNKRMLNEMYVSLNDFYEELGLEPSDIGSKMGWNIDMGMIEMDFSSQLSDDGRPCLVIDFNIPPKYGYSKFL